MIRTEKHNNNSNGQQRPQNTNMAQDPAATLQPLANMSGGQHQHNNIGGQNKCLGNNTKETTDGLGKVKVPT